MVYIKTIRVKMTSYRKGKTYVYIKFKKGASRQKAKRPKIPVKVVVNIKF